MSGARTHHDAGVQQLRAIVARAGWTVVVVPVTKVLPLKSAVTALPDGAFIGRSKNLDDACVFPNFVEVPEEHGTAVVDLGDGAVLISADAPQTAALFRTRGFDVVAVSITEFEKLEGCVTCLSVRIRHHVPMRAFSATRAVVHVTARRMVGPRGGLGERGGAASQ